MRLASQPFLTLAFACSLLLAGCETSATSPKAKQDPVSLQKKDETGAAQVSAPTETDADKISKLQQQVTALQQEVVSNRPKIAKIDVIEQKFKDLSLGLDKIDATYNMKPAAVASSPVAAMLVPVPTPVSLPLPTPEKPVVKPVAPAAAPPPPKPFEKPVEKSEAKPEAKPETGGEKVVNDLRIGEQKGFSRLVLDLGQSVKINYDIDNDEKILVIDIPGFTWKAAKSKTFEKSLLVASYQADTDAKGVRLVVQLRKAAKVSNYSTIAAIAGKMPRAVIDVAPQ